MSRPWFLRALGIGRQDRPEPQRDINNGRVSTADLDRDAAERSGLPIRQVRRVRRALIASLAKHMDYGKRVVITRFASFHIVRVPRRSGTDPHGKKWVREEHDSPRCDFHRSFKDEIADPGPYPED